VSSIPANDLTYDEIMGMLGERDVMLKRQEKTIRDLVARLVAAEMKINGTEEDVTNGSVLSDVLAEHHRFGAEKIDKVSGLGSKPALNGMDVAVLCYDAGWHDVKTLARALGTSISESAWHPEAFHQNLDSSGNVTSTDWGMWQINDAAHPQFFPNGSHDNAFDPVKATDYAFQIYNDAGQSFDPWYGFKNKVYLDDYYLRRCWLAVCNFGARIWVEEAEARPAEIAGRTTPPTKTRVPMISLSDFRKIYPPGT
jgi:lysozyme-like protein